MIKTPLSTVIGGAFWTPGATVIGGQQSFSQLIKKLFSNNEQGFFYDPNDLTTMFQNAAGTVPVTGVGQPVGLMLDKSKGMTLGAELLTNGDFSNGAIGWSTVAGSLDVVNNTCTVTATTAGAIRLGQPITTVVGKTYRVSVTILSLSAGVDVVAREGASLGAMGAINASYATTVAKTMTMYFVATSTDTVIYMNMTSSAIGQKYSVTGFTCKELAGNHAYQTTSASRPILRKNATTGAYYLEFDGSDDFLQTNNIDFTSTDKVTVIAGVRKLSDYSTGKIVELSNSVGNIGTFSLNAPDSNGASNFAFATNGVGLSDVKVYGFASPTSTVLTAFGNNAASTVQLKNRLRVNGVYPTATYGGSIGAGNYGNYPLYIGRRGGTSIPFNGHIYSLIGVGRLTTDSETAAIEKELAKRAGVTLSV